MRRHEARKIVEAGITWGKLRQILIDARESGMANTERSIINKGMTKGTVFNILWRGFGEKQPEKKPIDGMRGGMILATHILREFGSNVATKKDKKELPPPHHEDPIDIEADPHEA